MDAEENLATQLSKWYDRVLDMVLELDLQYYMDNGIRLIYPEIQQILLDNHDAYKTIIGKYAINTFTDTAEKVDTMCEIKEKEVIVDTLIQYDDLHESTINKYTIPEPAVDSSTKSGRISGFFNNILKMFNISLGDAEELAESFGSSITTAVRNTLQTPDLLFDIIPNEGVLDYLENRVFVASEKTMERVTGKIYDIISRESEIEGKHPWEISKTLREEYAGFREYETHRIARTEVLRAKNESTWQRLLSNETVEMIQWMAKVDESSRDEHAEQDGMITYIGNTFPNGQRYPYDETGDPGDYINCRCDYTAYYPQLGYVPPEGEDYWFEEDMVFTGNMTFNDFTVILE